MKGFPINIRAYCYAWFLYKLCKKDIYIISNFHEEMEKKTNLASRVQSVFGICLYKIGKNY